MLRVRKNCCVYLLHNIATACAIRCLIRAVNKPFGNRLHLARAKAKGGSNVLDIVVWQSE